MLFRSDDALSDNIDIATLCKRFERLHKFHPTEVRLTLAVADDLPRIRGNSNQLIQALLNLVLNAEYASRAAGLKKQPPVRVSAVLHSDVIHLDVIDHGPGIPMEKRAAIFDPFYSTKPLGEGTGLGLTVVQAIAAAHNGRIEIHDTPGGGSTFRMVLPYAEFTEEAATPETEQGDATFELTGVRILIAEDEKSIRHFLRRLFERLGVDATLVEDATRAIDTARREDFDVLLLDVRMPGGGGVEAYRRIREMNPQLARRTVFMTGEFSMEMNQIVGQEYAGVLQKPFRSSELLSAIQKALQIGSPSGSPL